MADGPSFVFRVVHPVLAPIPARAGELVAVWPGHPTHTLTVLSSDGRRALRHRVVEDGALYGPLLSLDADGVLVSLTPADGLRPQQQPRAS